MRDTRIQKAMADQGLCSRRAAEQIILEGRVKLNGRPVQLGDKMDIKADILSVDGQRVFFDKKKEYTTICSTNHADTSQQQVMTAAEKQCLTL